MPEYRRDLRGIPLWLLREYLQELGGRAVSEAQVEGPGWEVSLTQLEDFQVGSLRVGQVRLHMQAAPGVYEQFLPRLEQKLLRAGG